MAKAVYFLCAMTSVGCVALLLRAYARRRTRVLLWCALCFVGLALNNLLLFTDLVLVPDVDLSFIRQIPALAGILVLLYGLVWDVR